MNLFEFDKAFDVGVLCGVDEAGRGPLAGPVVAAAVVLNYDNIGSVLNVNDSKKISKKKRNALYKEIVECCVGYGVGVVDVAFIERHNILNAALEAMKIAVEQLKIQIDLVLVDGNKVPNWRFKASSLVGGDGKSACVAAASIVAKVERDRIMMKLDEQFPNYGFAKHKGYATKLHYENIEKFGFLQNVHRLSFLKKKLKNKHQKKPQEQLEKKLPTAG